MITSSGVMLYVIGILLFFLYGINEDKKCFSTRNELEDVPGREVWESAWLSTIWPIILVLIFFYTLGSSLAWIGSKVYYVLVMDIGKMSKDFIEFWRAKWQKS